MVRELLIAGAIAGAAIGAAPAAVGEPAYPDKPGRYDKDVPGMNYDAHLSAPGTSGEPLACHWIPNQWPPVYTGFWVISYPLHGVQEIGAPCPGPQAAAQAPDGRTLLCLGARGWQAGTFTGDGFFPA